MAEAARRHWGTLTRWSRWSALTGVTRCAAMLRRGAGLHVCVSDDTSVGCSSRTFGLGCRGNTLITEFDMFEPKLNTISLILCRRVRHVFVFALSVSLTTDSL